MPNGKFLYKKCMFFTEIESDIFKKPPGPDPGFLV